MKTTPYLRDATGAAAVEFALVLSLMVVPVMAVIDIGTYTYAKMQLDHSAQVGAQYVWATCNTPAQLPVTKWCPITDANVLSAAQAGTQLGTSLTAPSSGVVLTEYYYCLASGSMTPTQTASGTFASPIASEATACASGEPMEYVTVSVQSTYHPVFGGISVASLLGATLTKTSKIRIY